MHWPLPRHASGFLRDPSYSLRSSPTPPQNSDAHPPRATSLTHMLCLIDTDRPHPTTASWPWRRGGEPAMSRSPRGTQWHRHGAPSPPPPPPLLYDYLPPPHFLPPGLVIVMLSGSLVLLAFFRMPFISAPPLSFTGTQLGDLISAFYGPDTIVRINPAIFWLMPVSAVGAVVGAAFCALIRPLT